MKPPEIDLTRAVVAITGAGRGIGRATAELFADRGATVCLGDLDLQSATDAAAEIGASAHPFELDVASPGSFAAFIAGIEQAIGPIDVFVNNAGIMPKAASWRRPTRPRRPSSASTSPVRCTGCGAYCRR